MIEVRIGRSPKMGLQFTIGYDSIKIDKGVRIGRSPKMGLQSQWEEPGRNLERSQNRQKPENGIAIRERENKGLQ